jgi:hypothetical protein
MWQHGKSHVALFSAMATAVVSESEIGTTTTTEKRMTNSNTSALYSVQYYTHPESSRIDLVRKKEDVFLVRVIIGHAEERKLGPPYSVAKAILLCSALNLKPARSLASLPDAFRVNDRSERGVCKPARVRCASQVPRAPRA